MNKEAADFGSLFICVVGGLVKVIL
jgi:hypothetical protein